MAAELLPMLARAADADNDTLSGAEWYFYATGTSTPQSVYTTSALSVAHANPVVADSGGKFAPIYFNAALSYRGVLKDASGNTIFDIDPINTALASLLAASGGSALVTFLQSGNGAVARTVQSRLRDTVSVKDFGATGDGATDDTAAIQAAIDAVEVAGGTVYFPCSQGEQYLVTATLVVSSRYGVNLISEMGGRVGSKTVPGPCIIIGAAMDSVIRYEAPDSLVRGDHGAGTIKGLVIADLTGASDGTPGDYAIANAALHLKDFLAGLVEDCTIQWVKGRAILTDYAVLTTVRGGKIRYCGDTADTTDGVIELGATSASITTQSFSIDDVRMEVNHTTYIKATNTFVKDVKIRGCQFEAATTEYPTSSQTFIEIGIDRYLIRGCGFNRNDAVPVKAGGRGQVTHNAFANAGGSRESLLLSGNRILAEGNHFEDNGTAFSIKSTGVRNKIVNNILYNSGGIQNSGRGGQVVGNEIDEPTQTTGDAVIDLAGGADLCSGNYINDGSTTPVVDGIVSRGVDLVTGNMFDGWSAMSAIVAGNVNASIGGNTFAVVVTPYSGVTAVGGFNINGTKVLGPRQAFIADPSGGATVDAESRAAIAAAFDLLIAHGIMAPA